MKRIGEHLFEWIATFRWYVYFKKVDPSTSTTALVVDPDGKVGTNTSIGSPGVDSVTTTDGTYIDMTPNTPTTGAVTVTSDLSAVDGTSDVTTRFLSKDNTWDVPTYTTGTGGAMFAISGMENSFNENRWLVPRRYKLSTNPTGTSNGDYLSGASEDFSAAELANIDFVTHLRLQNFMADGNLQPVRYEGYIAMQQIALHHDLEFGVFEASPSDGDADLAYTFTSYDTMQPHGVTNKIKRISGTISDTLAAGTMCSFGFHNPTWTTPADQDIDDFRYWITVYFN